MYFDGGCGTLCSYATTISTGVFAIFLALFTLWSVPLSSLSSHLLPTSLVAAVGTGGIDGALDRAVAPIADWVYRAVFFSVSVGETELPLIVVWLIVGAIWFTFYFRFVNIRGFKHALRLVSGKESSGRAPGEVSHFSALTTALSGTVGVGNIAAVAILVSVAGPGATFWLIVAGFLGMSTKFVECTLGVKYRQENADGSMSGGPMFYIDRGLKALGRPRLGRTLALYYAVCLMIGCLGIGCMFQSNQAYVQFRNVTGGSTSFFADRAWLFGLLLAVLVGLVIMGGIRSIARVTSKLVPLMAVLYLVGSLIVIGANISGLPAAFGAILSGAFTPEGIAGGFFGVMVMGFRRALFSNEAGIGSASVAHAAVRTKEPVTEGYVAMLGPFIDTVVICTLTSLVIILTVWQPGMAGEAEGVELTSRAFASVVSWFPYPLAAVVMMFAFSTMISWSYYGLAAFVYLFGAGRRGKMIFNTVFCGFVLLGCTTQMTAIIQFSDSLVFAMALANILALYFLAPVVKSEVAGYWRRRSAV